jgi:hypothetical protein
MGLSDHVDITIARNSLAVQRATITVPLILSATAAWAERTREYTDLASVAADFPATTGPEYLAAQAMFSQEPAPKKIKIGRLANKPTQVYVIGVATVRSSYDYIVNVTGDGVTTSTATASSDSSATNDEIVDALVTALNAVVGKNYTAAATGSGGSHVCTVTGSAAGDWFALEAGPLLTVKQTHVDPGVATDLAAILLADPSWYFVISNYNSNAVVNAIAAWTEANKRAFVFDVAETDALNTAAGNSDTLDDIHTLDYARTMGAWHPRPAEMLSAAWVAVTGSRGGALTVIPSWKFQNLKGVSVTYVTPTQRGNLIARNANLYETVAGRNFMSEGTTGSGEFLDTIVGLDWLEDDMAKGQLEAFLAAAAADGKIPYEDPGAATLEGKMRASLKRAVKKKILAASPKPDTQVPLVADQDPSDRAARVFPDMKFSGQLSGAIHKTIINGSVTA